MSNYECPNCDGGFPEPGQEKECPWCGQPLDKSYGDARWVSEPQKREVTAEFSDTTEEIINE